jgi:hypothetical protein
MAKKSSALLVADLLTRARKREFEEFMSGCSGG